MTTNAGEMMRKEERSGYREFSSRSKKHLGLDSQAKRDFAHFAVSGKTDLKAYYVGSAYLVPTV